MYEDIYQSIRNAAQKRNLRESTINLYCNDVRYFLHCTGKEIADLTIEMPTPSLPTNVSKAGLPKLIITIILPSGSFIKRS